MIPSLLMLLVRQSRPQKILCKTLVLTNQTPGIPRGFAMCRMKESFYVIAITP